MQAAPLDVPLYLRIGRQNMAAEAFRAVRLENLSAEPRDKGGGPAEPSPREVSLGFGDLIDALNPLQHLPGVASIYRSLTGDDIGPLARLAGGLLYGGPIGFGLSLADAVLKEASGDDVGGHVMTALFGGDDRDGAAPQVAEASAEPAASPNPAPLPRPVAAAPAVPSPAPRLALSPDAFAALVASFERPDDVLASNPSFAALGAAASEPAIPPADASAGAPRGGVPADVTAAVSRALDKYEALNGQSPPRLASVGRPF